MFKFFKEKLSDVVKKFSKQVEEESEIVEEIKTTKDVKETPKVKKTKVVKETKQKVEKKPAVSKEKKPEPTSSKDTKPEIKKEEIRKVEKKILEQQDNKQKVVATEVIKDTSEEIKVPEIEEQKEEKKGFFSKIFGKKEEQKEDHKEVEEIQKESELPKEKEQEKLPEIKTEKPKETIFKKVSDSFTKFSLSDEKFEELFWDLEVTLLENNVAVEVIQKIKEDLREELTKDKISRKHPEEIIQESLVNSLNEVLDIPSIDLFSEIKKKKPYVIAVIGVNGSGKTTTIAKLCNKLRNNGFSIVLAAADTFRAAAIQQLEEHANKLDIKMIKHDYNSDPAAVAFDAIRHAESKGLDVVIIDTAGRLHSNDNLMNELKKLIRVNKPDFKLFVGESITGNDCVEQAKKYNELIGIDGIILSKADVDEKGGTALSISYVTKKPVLFIGTGQEYKDLKEFDKDDIIKNLGF